MELQQKHATHQRSCNADKCRLRTIFDNLCTILCTLPVTATTEGLPFVTHWCHVNSSLVMSVHILGGTTGTQRHQHMLVALSTVSAAVFPGSSSASPWHQQCQQQWAMGRLWALLSRQCLLSNV